MDYHTTLTLLHIFGVVVGLGGALTSDLMFFSSIRDEHISHIELRLLKFGSALIWLGLAIIIVSGALIFKDHTEKYLASAEFLAKMTIVGVILVNGIVFHSVHMPRFLRHVGAHFPSSDEFVRAVPFIIVSGVISMVSWFSALILGMWRDVSYGYLEIMSVYVFILLIVCISAVKLKKKLIPHHDS